MEETGDRLKAEVLALGRSVGLDAQDHVHKLLAQLTAEEQKKVVGGNAATVFNLN